MAYQPPTNPSLWQAVLSDEDGYVTTAPEALDEFGPESQVEVSIRRLSALPVPQTFGAPDGVWKLPDSTEQGDIAAEWRLDIVDDIGEIDHIATQLNTARAMATGLNGAIANAGDWNRSTALAAALHDLGDRIAAFTGTLPDYCRLALIFYSTGRHETRVANVDALSTALIGVQAVDQKSPSGMTWHRQAETTVSGGLSVNIHTVIPAPAEEDPDVLRARIAELEAALAGGAA